MLDTTLLPPSLRPDNLMATLSGLPWLDMIIASWKTLQKALRGFTDEGMYEVLEYESTLELLDERGERAIYRKRQKVRYLQNSIIAYQDQAWGDGKILLNYRCSPGTPVDQYRPAQKTYILISLREVRNRGDMDEFHIEWGIERGFVRKTEAWETDISHRTRTLKTSVIFPRARPPLRVMLIESTRQRMRPLEKDAWVRLPDGRWLLSWETSKPRLYERYQMKWDW